MYDCHNSMVKFHDEHVRLGRATQITLAQHRDTNLERLNRGLDKLSEQDGKTRAYPVDHCDQGSYAMRTMTQNAANEYDLDEAIIFESGDLPSSALDARKRIADAFLALGDIFTNPPEARTNAVTVWYAEGSHIDFAIYRRSTSTSGNVVIEHAGPDWERRNPEDITKWFDDKVSALSPSAQWGATVAPDQMRRVVRLLKAFSKSRDQSVSAWSLPGGLIISALVAECYVPDSFRDDVALYRTMVAIRNRLEVSLDVYNPVEPLLLLTNKEKHTNQVSRFKERLAEAIDDHLNVLNASKCSGTDSKKAWFWVFQHDFWFVDLQETAKCAQAQRAVEGKVFGDLTIVAEWAWEKNGRIRGYYPSGKWPLPRDRWLRFSFRTPVRQPYEINWKVKNYGDEAEEARDAKLREDGHGDVQWEHTLYKGSHTMICELLKDGNVVARAKHIVKITKP